MATIDRYKIVLDVEGQQAVKTLTGAISGLGTAIAGIGFGAFIGNALKAANEMVDLGKATGFTAGEVQLLGNALGTAGGKAEDVGNILKTFYQTLSDAATGTDKAVEALGKLGIAQSDLTKFSEGELFMKAVNALAQMDAGARRTALSVEVFSKAMKSVDPTQLAESLKAADPSKNDPALIEAARLVENLKKSYQNLEMAAINIIGKLVGGTDDYVLSVEKAEKALKYFAIALGTAIGLSTLASIANLVLAFNTLRKSILATALAAKLFGNIATTAIPGGRIVKILAAIGIAAGLSGDAFNDYEKDVKDLTDQFNKLDTAGQQAGAALPGAPAGTPFGMSRAGKPAFADTRATAEQRAMAMAAEAARQTTQQLREQNAAALEYQRIVLGTIGMHGNLANMIQQEAQIEQETKNKILELDKAIALERAKEKPNPIVIDELNKQKTLTEENRKAQQDLNVERFKSLETLRSTTMELERSTLTKTRQIELDLTRQQIEGMNAITLQEQTAMKMAQITAEEKKRIVELQKELTAAQLAGDQAAIRDIQERMRLEQEYYNTVRNLEDQRMNQELANRENRMLGIQRSLEQVARQYDPVRVAADQTTLLFDRMGSALEEFVKTGKMNFKDFALSLIRDMLMIQVKAQAMSFMKDLFGSNIGGGGIFGSLLGGLFGLASGGPAKANMPYIVGEKGPELFVPKSAGTVIPNGQTAAMNGNGRSVGISTPVTNNYITNNISAVDAKSVAKLFLENRKTLLGSVNMARKEMPYGV